MGMPDGVATVRAAIDLLHFPSQVKRIRSASLPVEVVVLLRIACGDEETTMQAAKALRRSRETVREAAAFFIEQILLSPDADSYRVLGARPGATARELRRNMVLLLRWLHPDLDRKEERTVFAARVTRAWNDLKTQERRANYDQLNRTAPATLLRSKSRSHAKSTGRYFSKGTNTQYTGRIASYHPRQVHSGKRIGFLRRMLQLLSGKAAW
jgi:hypothetical protein